jgi:ADP-ribosylglycohydrolase
MLGAISGDVIGSVHEWAGTKTKVFPLFSSRSDFTDDSVLTVAVAEWLLDGGDLAKTLRAYYAEYPGRGYGGMFHRWASSSQEGPYNSFGNGSAMRVSPVGFAFDSLDEVLVWATRSAEVTHNHPEGIRGAKATAAAIYYARKKRDKKEIRSLVASMFGYDLGFTLEEIRPRYRFDVTCQGSVPQAIVAFLESENYVDAIRNAISLGGDADTQACITGGIAEAYYGGVPDDVSHHILPILDDRMRSVMERFRRKFHLENEGPE